MKRVLIIMAVLINVFATAQDLGDLFVKSMGDEGAKQKASLDSIDFQLVMSVNENAAFFDIENKGEGGTKLLYAFKDTKEKTVSELVRDSVDYAVGLYNIRMFKLAQMSFVSAQKFMETNGLTKEISYLRCISNLGVVFLMQGRVLEAEEKINFALEMSKSTLGERSVAYAANLNSRAKLDQMIGKYNEAEKSFEEAGELLRAKFGKNSMQFAIVENNKAILYQTLGRYTDAVQLMKEAIKDTEGTNKKFGSGKKSFDNRRFQSNLALLYQVSGNLAEAETTFLSLKKIFENRGQTSSPEYAALLDQFALLYMQMGKMDQVEALLQKSAAVYKKKFTEENSAFAKVQSDLGTFYRMQGKFAEAEAALQKSLAIRKSTLGENHPDYVKSVESLGVLYWKKGNLSGAYPYFNEALTKSLDFINHYFPPMSEAEKAKYWDILQPRFQRFYHYAVEAAPLNANIIQDVYNYQIATKALLLNSTNKIKKAILSSGDKPLIKDYLSWIAQKETLARYYALSKTELKEQKIDLDALEKAANDMEGSLSQRSGDFSKGYSTSQVKFTQVASVLAETEAVVEVMRVRKFDKDFTDQSFYIVLVLTKGAATPKMTVLEEGTLLETRYAKFYKNAILSRLDDPHSYEQFWAKIEPMVAGKKVLYLSPDGVYNQINVNTLKRSDGKFLANLNDVVVIGNSKDMLALKGKKPIAKKTAFLLGFPDYGGAAAALPGTKVEIEGVTKLLKASGYQVTLRTAKDASEANLKAVKAPALMHIASHGYFLADHEIGSDDAMGIDAENAKNNPLLRSGLILAGAPDPKKGEEETDLESNDNGILTAYEAMNLNLEGTDLIVLSACETGLGDVKAGEGVYGLQRAFLVAGANALIMSLWKVDDAATQMLMTNFYTNWTKGGNKLKAFKAAQLSLMTKYKDPYYWGAFVMMGQ